MEGRAFWLSLTNIRKVTTALLQLGLESGLRMGFGVKTQGLALSFVSGMICHIRLPYEKATPGLQDQDYTLGRASWLPALHNVDIVRGAGP